MKSPVPNLGLLVLRMALGGSMLLAHGWGKLVGFSAHAAQFPDPLGVGSKFSLGLTVFAEFFCSAFVVLGILTRWSLLPLIVTMAVACFVIHASDPFSSKELSFLYLCGFVGLWLSGPGRWSVDHMILGRKS